MSIITRGYGGQTLATWGYGELVVELLPPIFITDIIGAAFTKLNGKLARYTILDDTATYFERIIAETSDELVVIPPDGSDLVVVPNVFVSYGGIDRIETKFNTIDTLEAYMQRVVSEEPIVQGFAGDNLDLVVIPTVSVAYEKTEGIAINHEISDRIETIFERVVPEEVI